MINIQCVKYLATALLSCVSLSAHALGGTIEFTGAFNFDDDTYNARFDHWGGFVISPIGSFGPDFPPRPGTTGAVREISLANAGVRDVPSFLTFAAAPHLRFDLTGVEPGIFDASACSGASVGDSCTPHNSALNLTNLPHGSTMSFSVEGQIVDIRDGSSTPYAGFFSGVHPAEYQHFLNDNGGTGWTYSAVFQETGPTAPIPELATWAMMLGGLACLGLLSVSGYCFPRTRGLTIA